MLLQHSKVMDYTSKPLKVHERNHTTHALEFVVVVFTLKIWIHYLYGVHIDIYLDHMNLQYVFMKIELNLRQRGCLNFLRIII